MKVQLIVVQGKPEGKVIPIARETFIIGRSPECHLRPNSDEISRTHAEITMSPHGVMIRDLGSRNGTMVNGKMLSEPLALRNGDLVQIAKLTFAIIIEGVPQEAGIKSPQQVAPAAVSASLDEASNAEIDSWLVTDPSGQTPDRPSGVFGGDTITINAYKAAQPPPAAAAPAQPAAAPAKPAAATTVQAPATASRPSVSAPASSPTPAPAKAAPGVNHFEAIADSIEALPEGEGDEQGEDGENADDEVVDDIPDELMDESNPFYVAKKKGPGEQKAADKAAYTDSSDAARDILTKMLEKRRAGKS